MADYGRIQKLLSATIRMVFLRVPAPLMEATFFEGMNAAGNEIFLPAFEGYTQALMDIAAYARDKTNFDLGELRAYYAKSLIDYAMLESDSTSHWTELRPRFEAIEIDPVFAALTNEAMAQGARMTASFPRHNVNTAGELLGIHLKQMLELISDAAYAYRYLPPGADLERALLFSALVPGAAAFQIDPETKAAIQQAMQALYAVGLGVTVLGDPVYQLAESAPKWNALFADLSQPRLADFFVECGDAALHIAGVEQGQLQDLKSLYAVVSSDIAKASAALNNRQSDAARLSDAEKATVLAFGKLADKTEKFAKSLLRNDNIGVSMRRYAALVPELHRLVGAYVSFCAIASADRFSTAVQLFEALQTLT